MGRSDGVEGEGCKVADRDGAGLTRFDDVNVAFSVVTQFLSDDTQPHQFEQLNKYGTKRYK